MLTAGLPIVRSLRVAMAEGSKDEFSKAGLKVANEVFLSHYLFDDFKEVRTIAMACKVEADSSVCFEAMVNVLQEAFVVFYPV